MPKNSQTNSPTQAAGIGFLFALPFIILNFIVSMRIEPLYSVIGSFKTIRNSPLLPLALLLLFPVGAFVALKPVLEKTKGKRKMHVLNIAVTAALLIIFFTLFFALGKDMYRCDILHIPNCD